MTIGSSLPNQGFPRHSGANPSKSRTQSEPRKAQVQNSSDKKKILPPLIRIPNFGEIKPGPDSPTTPAPRLTKGQVEAVLKGQAELDKTLGKGAFGEVNLVSTRGKGSDESLGSEDNFVIKSPIRGLPAKVFSESLQVYINFTCFGEVREQIDAPSSGEGIVATKIIPEASHQLGIIKIQEKILLPYLSGGTLEHKLTDIHKLFSQKNVTDQQKSDLFLFIMRNVIKSADQLFQTHAHKDIKEANIALSPTGIPYLIDTDSALINGQVDPMPDAGFSIPYMSPEFARGAPATKNSDIYALGVTLAIVLDIPIMTSIETALGVFDKFNIRYKLAKAYEENNGFLLNVVNESLPSFLKKELKEAFLSMLTIDPSNRPTSGELLKIVDSPYREMMQRTNYLEDIREDLFGTRPSKSEPRKTE